MQNKHITFLLVPLLVLIAIFLLVIEYNKNVSLPKAEMEANRALIAEERRVKAERELKMHQCLGWAWETYSDNWDKQCVLIGKTADCSLPNHSSDRLNLQHKESQDRCVEMYR